MRRSGRLASAIVLAGLLVITPGIFVRTLFARSEGGGGSGQPCKYTVTINPEGCYPGGSVWCNSSGCPQVACWQGDSFTSSSGCSVTLTSNGCCDGTEQ